MTDRTETVLAEAAEAYFQGLERDGYRPEGCSGAWAAEHILAALKAARIAVVELPTPATATENTAFWSPLPNFRVNRNVGVAIDAEGNVFAPDDARKYAAALLAAADAAEASQ